MGGECGDAGCIEFGPPPEFFPTRAAHPSRVLTPREGTALLFPSFYYHRTVPFRAGAPRISIAFDFEPA